MEMGWITVKPNRYPIFLKTDTEYLTDFYKNRPKKRKPTPTQNTDTDPPLVESGRAFQSTTREVRVFIDVSARGKRGKCMGSTLSGRHVSSVGVDDEPELNLHREYFCRTESGEHSFCVDQMVANRVQRRVVRLTGTIFGEACRSALDFIKLGMRQQTTPLF